MTADSNPFTPQPDASAQYDTTSGNPAGGSGPGPGADGRVEPAGYPSYGQSYGQSSGQATGQPPYGRPDAALPYNQPSYGSQYGAQPYATNPYGNPYTNPYGRPSNQPSVRSPLWAPWYGISFGHAIQRFFRKAFVFHGRASRGEYWWVMLFLSLAAFVAGLASAAVSVFAGVDIDSPLSDQITNITSAVFHILIFIPDTSLSVRRLHDENLSGWWVLLPSVSTILSFVATGAVVVSGDGNQTEIAQTMVIGMLVFFGSELLTILLSVILMILPSNPAGARFDRPPVRQTDGQGGGSADVADAALQSGQSAQSL